MSELSKSAGARLRAAVEAERPLQVVGTVNAYSALLAERSGFRAIYVSGAGVANASFGLPDLGMTSLNDVCEDVRRITSASELPLLVDADTGWGGAFNIAKTWQGPHQVRRRRHAPRGPGTGKTLRTPSRQGARARGRNERPDQVGRRWPDRSLLRDHGANRCACRRGPAGGSGTSAGVCGGRRGHDFRRSADEPRGYKQFTDAIPVPVLANITEFGKTPLFTTTELGSVGVRLVLYPLSAFRAMSNAALAVYGALRTEGTQKSVIDLMQDARATLRCARLHRVREKTRRAVGSGST